MNQLCALLALLATTADAGCKERTMEHYRHSLKNVSDFIARRKPSLDFDSLDLCDYIVTKILHYISPDSISFDLRVWKRVCAITFRPDYPGRRLDSYVEVLPAAERFKNTVTEPEFIALASAEEDKAFKNFWRFLLNSNLKAREALNLTWRDVAPVEPDSLIVRRENDGARLVKKLNRGVLRFLGRPERQGKVFRFTGGEVAGHFSKLVSKAGIDRRLIVSNLRYARYRWLFDRLENGDSLFARPESTGGLFDRLPDVLPPMTPFRMTR
ncbi:MAG: hypothetical protein LBF41_02145 [Deltaproteobacteria bacterium]|jgi:integrase|nr:hypothetical protein [Deltaproteobacteria bacterium]